MVSKVDVATQILLEKVDATCEAYGPIIEQETERTRPEAGVRSEWQERVDGHSAKHPGGTLPFQLRSFSAYLDAWRSRTVAIQAPLPMCHFCGHAI